MCVFCELNVSNIILKKHSIFLSRHVLVIFFFFLLFFNQLRVVFCIGFSPASLMEIHEHFAKKNKKMLKCMGKKGETSLNGTAFSTCQKKRKGKKSVIKSIFKIVNRVGAFKRVPSRKKR